MLQNWKNHGLWRLLAVLLMAVVLAAGCRSKPVPVREALHNAIEQQLQRTTSETESRILFQLTVDSDAFVDPQTEVVLGLMENITLYMKTANDLPGMKSSMQGRLDVGGMGFAFDIITADNMLLLQVPALATILQEPRLQQGFVVLRLDDLIHDVPPGKTDAYQDMVVLLADYQTNLELTRMMLAQALDALGDDAFLDQGETTRMIGSNQEKVRQIEVHLGEPEIRALVQAFVDYFRDETMRDLLYEMESVVSPDTSRDAFEADMDLMVAEMEPILEGMADSFFETVDMEKSSFVFTLFLNSDHQVMRTHFAGDAHMSPEPGTRAHAALEMTVDTLSSNESVTIEMPALTAENTVDMMELLWLLMFAF